MTIVDLWTLIEHGGLAATFVGLWWLERQERKEQGRRILALEGKLEKCLKERSGDGQ